VKPIALVTRKVVGSFRVWYPFRMRTAVFVRPGLVEWREALEPRIQGRGEAIVRPIVVGRCDLDVAFVRGLLPLASGEPIGHEIIGEVVEVSEDVTGFAPGDRVFVSAQISCGKCARCRDGRTGRCSNVPFAASYGMGRDGGFGGGLADLVRVPFAAAMVTPVPEGTDPVRIIGLADMAADAWRGIGPHLKQMPGASVLVIGGMPAVIGLYAVGIAAGAGACRVAYVDDDHERCAIANSYGAKLLSTDEIAPLTYDIVFVANPGGHALALAFASAAPGGVIVSASPTHGGPPIIDTADLYRRGLTWTIGRPDCAASHCELMDAWANGGFDPGRVPVSDVDWDSAPEAWGSDELYVTAVRRR
jgi:threonine dehydrogenase-like Zn-dependent dehydrogenase